MRIFASLLIVWGIVGCRSPEEAESTPPAIVLLRKGDLQIIDSTSEQARPVTKDAKIDWATPLDRHHVVIRHQGKGSADDAESRDQWSSLDLRTLKMEPLFRAPSPRVFGSIYLSPDRSKAAFLFLQDGVKLAVLRLADRNTETLLELEKAVGGISWAPDGRRIALVLFSQKSGEDPDVGVLRLDSRELKLVLRTLALLPAWSPDGKWIAFDGIEDKRPGIFTVDPEGKIRRRVAETHTLGHSIHLPVPLWSPNGDSLLYSSTVAEDRGKYRIWCVRPDGSDSRELAGTAENNYPLEWSKDGRRILFIQAGGYGSSDPRVGIMDADGRNARLLEAGETAFWLQ
jgi:Tol biopolymer transport system component